MQTLGLDFELRQENVLPLYIKYWLLSGLKQLVRKQEQRLALKRSSVLRSVVQTLKKHRNASLASNRCVFLQRRSFPNLESADATRLVSNNRGHEKLHSSEFAPQTACLPRIEPD